MRELMRRIETFNWTPPESRPYTRSRRKGEQLPVMESKSQVELLHEISTIVSSNLSLEKMLQELIGLAVEVTTCDACLVYLVDKTRREIVLRASQLPHTKEIGQIKLKMGEGITGWVAQNKSVVALGANAASDSRFKGFSKLQEDTYEAFLSVPLVDAGELIGVITSTTRTNIRTARTRSRSSPSWASRWAARSPRANSPNAPSAPSAVWKPLPDSPAK